MSDIPMVTAAEAARDERLLVLTVTECLTAGDVPSVVDLDGVGDPQEAAVRLGQAHRALVGVARCRVSPAAETALDALALTLSTVPRPGRARIGAAPAAGVKAFLATDRPIPEIARSELDSVKHKIHYLLNPSSNARSSTWPGCG